MTTDCMQETDSLDEAYNLALSLEKSGKFDEAADAFRRVLELDPLDCGGAAIRLAAMERGPTPEKAPDAYVATLFDQCADSFESILVGRLEYDVPNVISNQLRGLNCGRIPRMLDLGCGTGLCGESLLDICEHATGVDIAENMIEIAGRKEIYDDLFVAEIVNFLRNSKEPPWNLILAADVLPYFGRLDELFKGVTDNLAYDGVFAFSSESLAEEVSPEIDYKVGKDHRFAHKCSYVENMLTGIGLKSLKSHQLNVRYEEGEPVMGQLVIARKVVA